MLTLFGRTLSSPFRNVLKLNLPATSQNVQIREASTKHWKPEFRKLRGLKVPKVKIPNMNENNDPSKMTPDEVKSRMREMGVLPPRPWNEKPIFLSATGGVFEAYVPPEGDGKVSVLSKEGAKQSLEFFSKKSKSMLAVRKIRSFDEDFDPKEFSEVAQQLYIKAHKALAEKDHDTLHECVTELAFPLMTNDIRFCTVRWNFIKSLEPPRVVHVRCTDVVSKDNVFAQVTTRFHTQQTLAVYDRFGRLMFGNEVVAKDVLEYVVFEKHVANQYGSWRIHEKIIPDWMPPRDSGLKTFIQQAQEISAASETGLVSTKEKTVV